MYINNLFIKNFKCFKEVTLTFDPNINLIIGANNSGKSTSFDALRLWQLAFNKFLKDRTNNKQSSFRAQQYFSFTIEDISFLRVSNFIKLFFDTKVKKFEIRLTLIGNDDQVELPIIFTRTNEDQVLRFELCTENKKRGQSSDLLSKVLGVPKGTDFKSATLFTYINPIFNIPLYEPSYSKGYIVNRLHQAKVDEVIRNLLHKHAPLKKEKVSNSKSKPKGQKLIDIEKDLSSIIDNSSNDKPPLAFSTQLEDEDMYISIFGKDTNSNTEVEISQLGSGTLNILNILSVLAFGDYEKFKLNILLLDEPDSHLHADFQKKLFDHLEKVSSDENKQLFIITHNHELINCFEKVLFIDNKLLEKNNRLDPISQDSYLAIYKEIAPDYHRKMLDISEKNKIEKELEKIKDPNIPILFVEGDTDSIIIKTAYSKLYNIDLPFNIIVAHGSTLLKGKFQNVDSFNKTGVPQIALFDFDSAYDMGLSGNTKRSTAFHFSLV